MIDYLCSFGWDRDFYVKTCAWLDGDLKRRAVFIDDGSFDGSMEDSRIKKYVLETPLQIASFATQIASAAVFCNIEVQDVSGSPYFADFKQSVELAQRVANLCLSDAADWGVSLLQHAKVNLERPFRSVLDMQNAFNGIPAIIVGAGPSLEKNGHLLENMKRQALVFAGGSALEKIACTPHFSAYIDPQKVLNPLPFPDVPLCFQARTHPGILPQSQGARLLAPDSHFPFLNWLSEDGLFDGGWTVGTFMVSLAVLWGCNPIVLVGMDYCYERGRKYAFEGEIKQENLIQAQDCSGRIVWTQSDWLMAISWMRDIFKKYPDRMFFNATEGGMQSFCPRPLAEMSFQEIPDLQKTVDRIVQNIELRSCKRWDLWEKSLHRSQEKIGEEDLEEEIVYQMLLEPLWRIWKPVFERETVSPDQLRLHEMLFFQQVIQAHLEAF